MYSAGRSLSPARAKRWAEIFGRYIDRGATVLDLGCGTGSYSELIADAFDADVVGVDPSERMLAVAKREHAHPRIRYVRGAAEELPLDDASCDMALMSDVAHHLSNQEASVRELKRVLRGGGLVLVRGIMPRSLARVRFLEFFPAAQPLAREQSQAMGRLAERLADTGFEPVADEAFEQELGSFREYYDRVKLRAISTLELISDDDFEAGIARMREAANSDDAGNPVIEQIDLLVFRA